MFGWVEGVRSLRGDGAARLQEWIGGARSFGREQAARLFGWGGPEVEARAELLSRMIGLLLSHLRTKSYDEFVARFSNPGKEPDALMRLAGKSQFQMRMSPTCWYDAGVHYGGNDRHFIARGGGDDFGVSITASTADERIYVDFVADYGERPGRDAWAMVRALSRRPGYRRPRPGEALLDFDGRA